MYVEGLISECDFTGKKFNPPAPGYLAFSRGATGRVCWVVSLCIDAFEESKAPVTHTLEEVRAWAESVDGGYLDY